jgi:hypothetical protein
MRHHPDTKEKKSPGYNLRQLRFAMADLENLEHQAHAYAIERYEVGVEPLKQFML